MQYAILEKVGLLYYYIYIALVVSITCMYLLYDERLQTAKEGGGGGGATIWGNCPPSLMNPVSMCPDNSTVSYDTVKPCAPLYLY